MRTQMQNLPELTILDQPNTVDSMGTNTQDPFFDLSRDIDVNLFLPRFKILNLLGKGASGEVFLARDLELDLNVALKRVAPASSSHIPHARLKSEIRAARKITSPHVCQIYDWVELKDNSRALIMEYIPGITLFEFITQQGSLSLSEALFIAKDIAEGLVQAHQAGIIHRDLKPSNIMVMPKPYRTVILDFGIALSADTVHPQDKLTLPGNVLGTPLYMSPEQLQNHTLQESSDIYSLGILLLEMLTGKIPHLRSDIASLIAARLNPKTSELDHLFTLLQKSNAQQKALVFRLETLLRRMLSISPKSRPTASDCKETFEQLLLLRPTQRRTRFNYIVRYFAAAALGITFAITLAVWASTSIFHKNSPLPKKIDKPSVMQQEIETVLKTAPPKNKQGEQARAETIPETQEPQKQLLLKKEQTPQMKTRRTKNTSSQRTAIEL